MLADCAFMTHPYASKVDRAFSKDPLLAKLLMSEDVDAKMTPLGSNVEWSVMVPVETVNAATAASVLQSEARALTTTGLTQSELTDARRYLLNGLPVKELSDSRQTANLCARNTLSGAQADAVIDQLANISTATVATVNKFISEQLKPDQSTIVVAGSRESARGVTVKQ